MDHATEVKIAQNPRKVYNKIAKSIISLTQDSSQGMFDIALSGGNSPKGLFEKLSSKYKDAIPWERIRFWWGDERCVPPSDEQSNYKMTVDFLLSKISIPEANIQRIRGEEAPEMEAKRYAKALKDTLQLRDGLPVFDLIILGLGDDGHTASIFPNQMELLDTPAICAVARHPNSGQQRITICGKVLNNANRVYFLVTGENKATRVSEIMNDTEAARLLPAYHIAPKNGKLVWYLDEAAASLI